jgi:hypothetical protein
MPRPHPAAAEPLRATPPQGPNGPTPGQPPLEQHYMPAGQPRPRAALADRAKAPSIGGLIHSMQAKPSNAPYRIAAITSAVWFFVGGLLGLLMIGHTINDLPDYKALLATSSLLIMLATIAVPIALFWFIAQLVWRAQEMKLMASAMTEVAIRLAEPDKLAEQKVASVGQTIRRQVSAMDDAISRALGRAGELEALVHNEVAALERSYTQNEFIIRNLLQELVNEREAIVHNSQKVKETLHGVGTDVAHGIRSATETIGKTLAQHGTMSALKLQQAGNAVTEAMQRTTDETLAVKQKIAAELPALLDKMNTEQQRLGKVIESASHNLGSLNMGLAARTQKLDTTLTQQTARLDQSLTQHAARIDSNLSQHSAQLDTRMSEHTAKLEGNLAQHQAQLDTRMSEHATQLDSRMAAHSGKLDEQLTARSAEVDAMMARHASEINKRLVQKVKALDASLSMRAKALDKTLATRASEIDKSFLTHRDAIDSGIQDKTRELDESIARQARAMDASLTEKARAIDAALSQRMQEIETREAAPQPQAPQQKRGRRPEMGDTMLRGSEALERAMALQSGRLDRDLDSNKARLERTIEHQNVLSPQIGTLSDKHNALVREHAGLAASVRQQFAQQGQDLAATARLLTGPDMKMSAMMGPQQQKARAILADLAARSDDLEKSRRSFAAALDNSLMIVEETAAELGRMLRGNPSPRAERVLAELEHIGEESRVIAEEAKKELRADQLMLAQQVVEAISGMSRSTSRTRMLPGEVATTSTDVQKAVAEQLRALDALAQLSNAALGANRATASGVPLNTPAGGMRPGNGGSGRGMMPPVPPAAAAAAAAPAAPAARGPRQPSQWSFGDLLARVAETDADLGEEPTPAYRPASAGTHPRGSQLGLDPQDLLRMDDIARLLDSHTAAVAWSRYQSGERNVFTRRLYGPEGQRVFDQAVERYAGDKDFRGTVDKYVGDFERLMAEAEEKDPSGRVIQNYLMSESGRVYLVLAHASGRLG